MDKEVYSKLINSLEEQIEGLRKEKEDLLQLVKDCFKALSAKEAPMYYNDIREKEFPRSKKDIDEENLRDFQSKMYKEYVDQVENHNFFDSADDLNSMLKRMDAEDIISKVMPNTLETPSSLHNNEES